MAIDKMTNWWNDQARKNSFWGCSIPGNGIDYIWPWAKNANQSQGRQELHRLKDDRKVFRKKNVSEFFFQHWRSGRTSQYVIVCNFSLGYYKQAWPEPTSTMNIWRSKVHLYYKCAEALALVLASVFNYDLIVATIWSITYWRL
jgi:hypothetical protein